MDGTLGELDPTYFEYSMLAYRALDDLTYTAPTDVQEAALAIRDFVGNGTPPPNCFFSEDGPVMVRL